MNPINKRLPRLTHSNSLRSLSTNYSKNEYFEFPLYLKFQINMIQ